jgi:hypothetical protein
MDAGINAFFLRGTTGPTKMNGSFPYLVAILFMKQQDNLYLTGKDMNIGGEG